MNLNMTGISKSFGANLVLDKVSFSLKSGEITALLGENGAGKSTLMNILGGVLPSDEGRIEIDGKPVVFTNPRESLDAGIAFIHQELNLINDLAIYENLFIGRELKGKWGILDKSAMIEKTKEVFERMGLSLNPEAMVRTLDASYKQIVEISRAMLMDARIVIMDEPTTSLTETEIKRVFSFMRSLKKAGVGIIFISHKLNEVMEICDSYTVLRDGHMISSGSISSVTSDDLAKMMVGHDVIEEKRSVHKHGDVIFSASGVSDESHFKDISFSVRKGEVVGFTGLLGDGRSELFLSIFGAGSKHTGTVELDGKAVTINSPWEAIDHGIGYVPRNRKENGIVKDLDILENGSLVTMKKRRKGLFLDQKRIEEDFQKEKRDLSIKMGDDSEPITSLSGGNQQKVVLAKWLSAGPRILILDNPTQGVDVGAKEEIYTIISSLADSGVSVIVLSSEAHEIVRTSSRCYVMYHGKILTELEGDELNEHEIMRWATGAAI
ncbi:MAG: sugar ABC transporter ATP-binding protein [Spirochaetes bacterium]|uniref:Sugar ABC transporter ATP-binding protein n=1 Tax=Candidatus Ornithospirochaeta stercoripullorum TaxID=2840899 RepID=A0A9D9H5C1_9SPIO|nr:sugar ABC transporter ATP-binding protein [Candidatus Ornithospirochaeta stercoripullorum]